MDNVDVQRGNRGKSKQPGTKGRAFLIFLLVLCAICIVVVIYSLRKVLFVEYSKVSGSGIFTENGLAFGILVGECIVMVSAFIIPVYFIAQERKKDRDDPFRDLHIALYVLPFVVLSMALLFELKEITDGGVAGIGAISGVMILFLLSEIGAILFNSIRRIENDIREHVTASGHSTSEITKVAASVSASTASLTEKAQTLPLVGDYSRIISPAASTSSPPGDTDRLAVYIGPKLRDLVSAWGDLIQGKDQGKDEQTNTLLRVLLCSYYDEERKDIGGELSRESVPDAVWPDKFTDDPVVGKAAFITTNVGFYSGYLSATLRQLSLELQAENREKERVPCIACITSVLPSHLWNWMRREDGKMNQSIYEPIDSYRQALEEIAASGANVSRIVLIKDDSETEPDREPGEQGLPLFDTKYWQETESRLMFKIKKGDAKPTPCSGPEGVANGLPFINKAHMKWLPAVQKSCDEGKRVYPVFYPHEESESGGSSLRFIKLDGVYKCVDSEHPQGDGTCQVLIEDDSMSVLDYYAHSIHPAASRGKTQIWKCSAKIYRKFCCRPDVVLIGTVGKDNDNIWKPGIRSNEGAAEWKLALLANMSTESETMFLCVVHSPELIRQIWEREILSGCKAVRDHGNYELGYAENGNWNETFIENMVAAVKGGTESMEV